MEPLRGQAPLSSEDVLVRSLPTVALRPGYDVGEVDLHLEAIAQALRAYERGEDGSAVAHSSQVSGVAFAERRIRRSYAPAAVDDLLAELASVLRGYETGALTPPMRTVASTSGAEAVPAAASDDHRITADEVVGTMFETTRLRDGYDQDTVDRFLDECVAALRGDGPLTATDVREARFPATRFRDGYDMEEVDAVLERIARTLEAHGSRRP